MTILICSYEVKGKQTNTEEEPKQHNTNPASDML